MISFLKKKRGKYRNRGFTLVEVLIVIAIMAILSGVVIFSFSGMRARQDVDSNTEVITSLLKEARSRTLGSIDSTTYGVFIETNQVTLFKGASYIAGDPTNQTNSLSNTVTITAVSLNGGGSTIMFERLTGKTNNFGTMRVEFTSDTSVARTITVDATGLIESD